MNSKRIMQLMFAVALVVLGAVLVWSMRFQSRHWKCCSSAVCGTQGHHMMTGGCSDGEGHSWPPRADGQCYIVDRQ